MTQDRKILQTIPQSLIQALIDGQKQGLYVYPDGRDIKIDISSAIAIMSASRIQCSREQYEMYCDMGTSFQVCKICSENNKDRKLEPCGHLICSSCLENWQELQSHPSCPFCRCEIKTFEPVIISPFEGVRSRGRHRSESLRSHDSSNDSKNMVISPPKEVQLILYFSSLSDKSWFYKGSSSSQYRLETNGWKNKVWIDEIWVQTG